MTIKTRMIIGIAGAIFFLLASNLVTQYLINETNKTMDRIIQVNGVKLALLNDLKSVSDERAVQQRNLVLVEEPEQREEVKKELKASAERIFQIFEALNNMKLDAKEAELYESLKANVSSANTVFASFMLAVDEEFTEEAVSILMNEFQVKYQGFTAIVDALKTYEVEQNDLAIEQLVNSQDNGAILIWSWLALSVVLFSLVGWLVARSFLKPINAIADTVDKIAKTGDLSHRVPVSGKDELAQMSDAMNQLFDRMSRVIEDVVGVMEEVAEGKFDRRVEAGKRGQFLRLRDGVNNSIDQINAMMGMMQETAKNFRGGELKVAVNNSVELKGSFSTVIQDFTRSAELIKITVDSIAETLDALSQGDFSARSDVDASGDFVALKESINVTLNDLERFVEEVAHVQGEISKGDLTNKVNGVYQGKMAELKEYMNDSVSNIALMVGKVGGIASDVADGAGEIAKGNESVSSRIHEQAAALEQTSATMEEMTSTVRQNAENAQQVNQVTGQVQEELASGLETMKDALDSMAKMSEASQKINDIITLIDAIAFQTNLLALNAAVEAARAGEHGRGFAVVASEVRNLAGKSADAAGEIKKLIENSVHVSDETGRYVQQTSDVMTKVNESLLTVGKMVAEISQATVEQAQGIEQVNSTVVSMDQMTQDNAAVVQRAAQGSAELLGDAEMLREQVSSFIVDSNMQKQALSLGHSEDEGDQHLMIADEPKGDESEREF